MTPAIYQMRGRAESFGALAQQYASLANNTLLEDAERAACADIADLLGQIEDRFDRAVLELGDQQLITDERQYALEAAGIRVVAPGISKRFVP